MGGLYGAQFTGDGITMGEYISSRIYNFLDELPIVV